MSGRSRALTARNRELASEIKQLRVERRRLHSQLASANRLQPVQTSQPSRARAALARDQERRRLQRDLHDGVQNELVALIVKLSLAEQDPNTPPSLNAVLSALGADAKAVLESVREIARGVYSPLLASFGVERALRAQGARASIHVRLEGTAPRSSEEAEAAV